MRSPDRRPAEQGSFRLGSIAVPAYGPTLVASVGHGAILPLVALHARELGASVSQAALMVGLVAVGQLLNSLPAGAVVARIGERRALTLTGVAEALVFLGAWRTHELWVFAVLVTLMGMAWTVFLLARQGFIIDAAPPAFRARALSTLGGVHRIGLFVGPLVAAGIVHRWGLAAVFVLAAATSLTAAVIVQTMPDLSADTRARAQSEGHASVWSVLRDHRRRFATVGTAVAVISASRALRVSVVPLWCEHIGLSAAATSLVFGIAAAVDMTLFYPAGWVMDRFGRAWVAFPVVAAVAVGVMLLPLARSFATVLAVSVLMAVGNGLGSGIVMTMGADTAPSVGRAQYLGGWRLAGDVGGTSAPLLFGLLVGPLSLAAACGAVGVLGLLGTGWVTWWTLDLDRSRSASAG
ncbi:MAG: MFS transporter [Nocardioidaceae bacterium]